MTSLITIRNLISNLSTEIKILCFEKIFCVIGTFLDVVMMMKIIFVFGMWFFMLSLLCKIFYPGFIELRYRRFNLCHQLKQNLLYFMIFCISKNSIIATHLRWRLLWRNICPWYDKHQDNCMVRYSPGRPYLKNKNVDDRQILAKNKANNLETRDKPCDGESDVASVPVRNSIKIIQGFLQNTDKIV